MSQKPGIPVAPVPAVTGSVFKDEIQIIFRTVLTSSIIMDKANYLKNNRENMNPNDVQKLEKLF